MRAARAEPVTRIVPLDEILAVLPALDLVERLAAGFVAYSEGRVDVPPVGELLFPEARGEMHVKYGAVRGDAAFVVKIATGFFANAALGLPPFGGCMLVFSQRDGSLSAVLLEEGELTNHRTAAAGALAARTLAPADVPCIGILGAGVQARLQARYLLDVTACRDVSLWARDPARAAAACEDLAAFGFAARPAPSVAALAADARLIVTTTASEVPLLLDEHVRPGTHVTAMGSDTPHKTELDPALLGRAGLVVADSASQCRERGEIHHALAAGSLAAGDVVELGAVISGDAPGRARPEDITVCDLTGVAVQDIVIATAVLDALDVGTRGAS